MYRTSKTSKSIEVLFIITSMLRTPRRTLWSYLKKVFFCRLHSLQCCLFLISRTRTITIPIFLFNLLPLNSMAHASWQPKMYSTTRYFFNLSENKVYQLKIVFEGPAVDTWWVDSSQGCLVVLDDVAKTTINF